MLEISSLTGAREFSFGEDFCHIYQKYHNNLKNRQNYLVVKLK
jgi:hypothetical protein